MEAKPTGMVFCYGMCGEHSIPGSIKKTWNRTEEAQPVLRCPLELFTGMRPSRSLMPALNFKYHENVGIRDEMRARQLLKIREVLEAMVLMHKDVAKRMDIHAKENFIKAHNKKLNIQSVKRSIGGVVLVRVAGKKGHKLEFNWRGPRRITNEVENLSDGAKEIPHASKILP